jgi:enoyl-CoA hydratase/carnithine racemase
MLENIFHQPQYALSLAKLAVKASQSFDLPRGLAMESAEFSRCFESDFFKNLMREQLEQGTLQTTTNTGN